MAKKYENPRPRIPAGIRREVKIEARDACLVCTERVSLTFHHIDENRENNDPLNIVYICSNCHGMVHDSKISRNDLREYKKKANGENEEITKLRKALEYYQAAESIIVSEDFGKLKLKYQGILDSYADSLMFYQAFIYLIPEFYLDQRGDAVRRVVRGLLNISPGEESTILDHLQRLSMVRTVGGLAILQSVDDAKIALNELISARKIDVEKLVKEFLSV